MSTAQLQLHRKLYTATSVRVAKKAFAELATIEVSRDVNHFTLTFREMAPDVADVLTREFANYALAETIESRR
jgi:hypothetical protein